MRKRKFCPGLAAEFAASAIRKPEKPEESLDTQTRRFVVQEIKEYMKDGTSLEDAIEEFISDNPGIVNKFHYLEKNNVDLRGCFSRWVQAQSPDNDKQNTR